MPVQLDDDEYPVAWGDSVEGEDIPDPPAQIVGNPNKRAKWDRAASAWIEDPDLTPPDRPADIMRDFRDGTITQEEALERLLESLSR